MKRIAGPLVFGVVTLLFAALMGWLIYIDLSQTGQETAPRISVVVYGGENADRWKSLEQGIRQACIELGIEKPVLTTVRADDLRRQAEVLEREVSGADGLLVAVGDVATFEGAMIEFPSGVQVVTIESGVAGDYYPLVAADNERMGWELANRLAAEEGRVAVLAENLGRQSVNERYVGFVDRMKELGHDVQVLQRDPSADLRSFIASSLAMRGGPDVLVVLDNETLEVAIEAAPAAMVDVRICGVGSSSRVVHALDTGVVDEIVFTNEYAIGYIGTMTLAAEMGLAKPAEEAGIQYSLVRRETMYDPEIEKLLFPIVQ